MKASNPIPLQVALGARLKQLREAKGWRQEDLARGARGYGYGWSRATVAQVERGARNLTLEEWYLLPLVMQVEMRDLLPTNGMLVFFPSTRVPVAALRAIARNKAGSIEWWRIERPDAHQKLDRFLRWRQGKPTGPSPEWAAYERLWQRQWPDKPLPSAIFSSAQIDAAGDAECKAAGRLGVAGITVAMAARGSWGRSFSEERDQRVAAESGTSPRTLQALRGHVTRILLTELRPLVLRMEGRRVYRSKTTLAEGRRVYRTKSTATDGKRRDRDDRTG
jgi:transcriptional regulator with XRE-family HTH domain